MDSVTIITIIVAYTVAYAIFFIFYFRFYFKRIRERKFKRRFFYLLLRGINNSTITTIEDIRTIYVVINQNNFRYNLNNWLREFFVNIIDGEYDDRISNLNIIQFRDIIVDFISVNEDNPPFLNLPDDERNILIDVNTSLTARNIRYIKEKL